MCGVAELAPAAVPLAGSRAAQSVQTSLASLGVRVMSWTTVEVLVQHELRRRARSRRFPELISAAEFAGLCGLSRNRIYGLEAERRRAADRGDTHPFPPAIVPGWWWRVTAEVYARRRRGDPTPEIPSPAG